MMASRPCPRRTPTLVMPSNPCSSLAGTSFGPGAGAVPGAGCGKAVERAVWKVTLPSTFCMSWWMWPLSTVTEPKRSSSASACGRILRAPAPFGSDGPQGDMREDDDRRRGALALQIVGEPRELLGAEIAHAARLQIDDIDEADEMHAAMVEGIPAFALGEPCRSDRDRLGRCFRR